MGGKKQSQNRISPRASTDQKKPHHQQPKDVKKIRQGRAKERIKAEEAELAAAKHVKSIVEEAEKKAALTLDQEEFSGSLNDVFAAPKKTRRRLKQTGESKKAQNERYRTNVKAREAEAQPLAESSSASQGSKREQRGDRPLGGIQS